MRSAPPYPGAVEGGEVCERAAFVAVENALQSLGLAVRDAIVEDDADLPVTGGQVRREQVAEGEVDA
jgi:hypothetical protein